MRYDVTPLTTFVLKAATRYDRFETARDRDSDSLSLLPGFEFKPFALISGSAAVGFRRFTTRATDRPDYTGLIAAVDITYVARDTMKLGYRATRDVDYSFEPGQAFFLSSLQVVNVTQALGYDWDVVGRFTFGRLTYPGGTVIAGELTPGRVERVRGWGTGLGRRLGEDIRIGFDVDFATRTSSLDARKYDGFRFGGSVTYGQ